jgi:hypothetical protein
MMTKVYNAYLDGLGEYVSFQIITAQSHNLQEKRRVNVDQIDEMDLQFAIEPDTDVHGR